MIELRPHEVLIIDTPLFQRLRGIFQTGFTYLVYPCAVHTRFEHSLGCVHLAGRMIQSLKKVASSHHITKAECATVRLAALLHDLSHGVFSHVSEKVYELDTRIAEGEEAIRREFPPDRKRLRIGAAEVITYHMITSPRFQQFFEKVRNAVGDEELPPTVNPRNIARLIVGLAPEKNEAKLFLAQIVNGPFDVDKLDYQTRDGHFTGIAFRVDVERLLASLCVLTNNESSHYLGVDHRGVAAIEQLLFNRMLLYDSVYHHHKNRAAAQLFTHYFDNPDKLPLEWLLVHDEYDFFGLHDLPDEPALSAVVRRLRHRDLPHRAAIIHPSTVNAPSEESPWAKMMLRFFSRDEHDRKIASDWFSKIKGEIVAALPEGASNEIYLDLPTPPRFQELQRGTHINYAGRQPLVLDDIFPITSALNSYVQQCKYRIYVFSGRENRGDVAAVAYNVFRNHGVQLNKEAFRLAKLDPDKVAHKAGVAIPSRTHAQRGQ
jgi:HD superfamily phosphohydrolase